LSLLSFPLPTNSFATTGTAIRSSPALRPVEASHFYLEAREGLATQKFKTTSKDAPLARFSMDWLEKNV